MFLLQSSQSTSAPATVSQAAQQTFSGAVSGQYTQFGGFQGYSQALAPGVPPQQQHFNAAPAPPSAAPGKSISH